MKKIFFALALLAPTLASAVSGPYVTVQAGVNTVNVHNAFQNSTVGFAGGAATGYLWGNNNINYGVEADAVVYPNSNSSKSVNGLGLPGDLHMHYDGYNLSLLGILKYTAGCGFTAFVKAGGAYVEQQLTASQASTFTVTTKAENAFAPEAAVGVGYMFNPNLEVSFTFDRVFADNITTAEAQATNLKVVENDNYLLGLTYHFA